MENKKMGIGVGVILLRNRKILFGKRNSDPRKAGSFFNAAGTWTLPGGKMDFGESFEDAAKREVKEETSIEVRNLKLISLTNNIASNAHFVTIGFLCEDFEGDVKVMEPDEITEWKWFDKEKLPSPIYQISEQVLKNYKEGVIYKQALKSFK